MDKEVVELEGDGDYTEGVDEWEMQRIKAVAF